MASLPSEVWFSFSFVFFVSELVVFVPLQGESRMATRSIFTAVITIGLSVGFLASCGSDKGPNSSSMQKPEQPSTPSKPTPNVITELQGQWKSNCINGRRFSLTAPMEIGISQISQLSVDGLNFTEILTATSGQCDTSDIVVTSTGSFQETQKVDDQPRALDISVQTYKVIPKTEFGRQVLNVAKWCGISDWAIEGERDVTAQVGTLGCFSETRVRTHYSIQNDKLFVEQKESPTNSRAGPVQMNFEQFFVRQ